MRYTLMILAAAIPLAACTQTTQMVESDGMPRGALGVAAIDRGDLVRAEQLLENSVLDRDDPARLINLGYVYMEQGRRGEAIAAWQEALASNEHHMVETMTGREVRTDQLAREILARQRSSLASAR